MNCDELQEQINEMRETVSALVERVNSVINMHQECKKLQKERLDNTGNSISSINAVLDKFQENVIRNINKFQEKTAASINELSNANNLINSNLNIVTNNVKDIVEYKKTINGRITRLVIAIITAILISLSIKGVDWVFRMHRISNENQRNIGVIHEGQVVDRKPAGK